MIQIKRQKMNKFWKYIKSLHYLSFYLTLLVLILSFHIYSQKSLFSKLVSDNNSDENLPLYDLYENRIRGKLKLKLKSK